MTPPIVSIVGKSNSGKTTLLEKLIPEVSKRGYVVGTIKHDAHSFDIDHPGKDSARHTAAGSTVMVIVSAHRAAVVRRLDRELTLDQIAAAYMEPVDIVLTEGFKSEAKPKIEVLGEGDSEPLSPVGELLLVAAADPATVGTVAQVPKVSRDDVRPIADLLEARFLANAEAASEVRLVIDGKPIPLNRIMKAMVEKTVTGLVSSLKGGDGPGLIELEINRASVTEKDA